MFLLLSFVFVALNRDPGRPLPTPNLSGSITAVAAVLAVKTSSTAAAEQVWTLAVHALGVGGEEAVA